VFFRVSAPLRETIQNDRQCSLHGWLLCGALAIALCARLYFANRPKIGLDDATSADIAGLPIAAMLKFVPWNEPTMGLYYVLLHFWSAVAGSGCLA
jgi:mannosyltransferase